MIRAAAVILTLLAHGGAPPGSDPGLMLAGSSAHGRYAPAEPVSLSWTLIAAAPCRAGAMADGTVAVTGVTRDRVAVTPLLRSVSYEDGLATAIATRLEVVGPGGLTVDGSSEASGTGGQVLVSVSLSPTGQHIATLWPLREPGFYTVTAVYTMPPYPGRPADACAGVSSAATVRFRVGPPEVSPGLPLLVLAVVVLAVTAVAVAILFRRRRRAALLGFLVLGLAAGALVGPARPAEAGIIALGPALERGLAGCVASFTAPGGDPAGAYGGVSGSRFVTTITAKRRGDPNRTVGDPVGATNRNGSHNTIYWDPVETTPSRDGVARDPCATLYHELSHAWDMARGEQDMSQCRSGLSMDEARATHHENLYRRFRKLPERTGWSGVKLPAGGPANCDARGRPKSKGGKGTVDGECDTGGCASSAGDPHLSTFDGQRYDLQAVGEFVAAKSTVDNLEIQTRQAPFFDSTTVSVNTAVAANVSGDRVGVYAERTGIVVRVNGSVAGAGAMPSGGTLSGFEADYGTGYRIAWPDGSVAWVSPVGAYGLTVTVKLATARRGTVVGLLAARGSTPRVTDVGSLFDYAPGQSTATFTDLSLPSREVTAATVPGREAAEAICRAAGVTDVGVLADCVLDVAVTGQASFVSSALATPASTAAAITLGDTVSGAFDPTGGRHSFTFDGTAGQRVYLHRIAGECFHDWRVVGPDGTSLAGSQLCADLGPVPLTRTGRHTVLVTGAAGHPGDYRFAITDVPPDRTFPIATGDSVSPGHPAGAGTLTAPGQQHLFTFQGTAGQQITLTSTAGSCFLTWQLLNPDGRSNHLALAMCGDLGAITLPVTGRYTVAVSVGAGPVGDYGFTLR